MKNTTWAANWERAKFTSFHGETVTATLNELRKAIGKPDVDQGSPDGKITYMWIEETEDGDVYTIYDHKEYRKFGADEKIVWHIGAANCEIAEQAACEIEDEISSIK